MFRRGFVLAPAVLSFLLAGCGGASTGTVSGDVTLDGQPMKKGSITFTPADGKSTGVSADVVDGKYTATVPTGDMSVAIASDKVVGQKPMYGPGSKMVDETVQVVAKRYNTETQLKVTVKGGPQTEKFDVQTK